MQPVIKVIRPSCFHRNNCPQGLSPLALGNKTKYHKIMRQKGSFWNWYKMMGIMKALKCCQNLYQVVVCPCPGALYMFEKKNAKSLSLPRTKCQVSFIGPLVLWFNRAIQNHLFFIIKLKVSYLFDYFCNISIFAFYIALYKGR